jgi:hypothetical protein
MQSVHFRPAENRAVTIDDKIASAHGRTDIIPPGPVVMRISLA